MIELSTFKMDINQMGYKYARVYYEKIMSYYNQ